MYNEKKRRADDMEGERTEEEERKSDREKQAALESWERKLLSIVTGAAKDNVISITKGKVRKAA